MIDVHNHLLPAVDDGSRSVEQSVRVLELFVEHGVTDVVCTPHLTASELSHGGDRALETRMTAYEKLKQSAPSQVSLHLGFEIMMDQPISHAMLGDRRFSLAGSRYYLIEFWTSVVAENAVHVIRHILDAGMVPLVAHPERYGNLSIERALDWHRMGARFQVDATTLGRRSERGSRARRYLENGLADITAADNHGDDRTQRNASRFLESRGEEHLVDLLTTQNPGATIRDEDMIPVPAMAVKERLLQRISRKIFKP